MNKKILWIGLLSAALIQGCSHGATQKKLDEKLAMQDDVHSRSQLVDQATNTIEKAPGLNAEQKSKLLQLRDSMKAKNDALIHESLQLRSVLIQDLVGPNYNKNEVALIKKKLKQLESKRLSLVFDAVERANTIMGRQAAANKQVLNDLSGFHGNRSN